MLILVRLKARMGSILLTERQVDDRYAVSKPLSIVLTEYLAGEVAVVTAHW